MKRLLFIALWLTGGSALAAESLPPGAKVVKLTATPADVVLSGEYSYAQILITATLTDGTTLDATRLATAGKPRNVSISTTGLVRPTGSAVETVRFELQGQTAEIIFRPMIRPVGRDLTISFTRDVMPLLGKMGCNAGTCHGAQTGKNGFKLSLRGYDPLYDHRSLTDDLEGRRFNRAAPEQSLMLLKTSGGVPHTGGVLWQPGEPNYNLVLGWIYQGVKFDASQSRVKSIELFPKNPTVQRIGEKQQFAVIATYPDGKTRDVSAETFIDSSNTEVATVDKTGLMTSVRRGETTMLARYEGAYSASTVVVMGDRTGFEWKPQPVNNYIDELVDAKLQRIKVPLSEMCTDEEFIRRVYLDLIGLPPTPEDVRRFEISAKGSHIKRAELIDKLVGSEAFVEHWTNKWGDLLQINRKFLGQPGAAALRKWVREAVAKNMPYDEFALKLLTGTGSNVENPPASYFKILREPDAAMENTTQLFLAIRFNCNKCHDHPFERWTQDQYYQLAAYFAQVNRKEDPKYKNQKIGGTDVEKPKPLVEIIEDSGKGEMNHLRTGAVSPPLFPFTHAEMPDSKLSRREQAARWIISDKNPYFARSYVNRVWSYLTGVGLIEPVDDIRAGNPPTNPELLDRLTREFIDSGFDTQKLIRTICLSRTYQLSVSTNKWNKDDEINFSHAMARRLPAEVLFDSVHVVTGATSKLPGMPPGARAAELLDSDVQLPGGFLDLLGKPARESVCECERSGTMMLGPVLAFINGPVVGDAVQDKDNRIAQFVLKEKDDAKVVNEIYLSVLNRWPTDAERDSGMKALRSAGGDFTKLQTEYRMRAEEFGRYEKTLDLRQSEWEAGLRDQKPTPWTTIYPKFATAKKVGDKQGVLQVRIGGAIFVSGHQENQELYTVTAEITEPKPITAIRLEALADAALPGKGPGRAMNGNFVLNEFKAAWRPTTKPDEKPMPIKFTKPKATYEQANYLIGDAIDNKESTGWAISPETGKTQSALFPMKDLYADTGVTVTFTLDQRFGQGHTLGKFRLSYAVVKNPRLTSPVSKDLMAMLETPIERRTPEVMKELRAKYLAQDKEYLKLKKEAEKVPPSDARILGAQDLVWALLNSPAFLFNR